MSGVEVHTDCPLPDVGETAPVYYAAPWTEANCDEYARPLLTALGEDFDAMEAERSEYRVDYTDPVHHSSLQVLFLGGFRAFYQNQSGATEPARRRPAGRGPAKAAVAGDPPAGSSRLLHGSGGLLLHGGWGRGWRAVSRASHLYLPGRWTDPVSQRRACCGTAKRRGFHLPPGEGRGTGLRREVFGYRRADSAAGRSVEEGGVVRSDIDTLTIQSITLAYLRDTKDYYQPVYAVKTDKGILYTLATQLKKQRDSIRPRRVFEKTGQGGVCFRAWRLCTK